MELGGFEPPTSWVRCENPTISSVFVVMFKAGATGEGAGIRGDMKGFGHFPREVAG